MMVMVAVVMMMASGLRRRDRAGQDSKRNGGKDDPVNPHAVTSLESGNRFSVPPIPERSF
jgi:hypothetical protein